MNFVLIASHDVEKTGVVDDSRGNHFLEFILVDNLRGVVLVARDLEVLST